MAGLSENMTLMKRHISWLPADEAVYVSQGIPHLTDLVNK